MRPGGDAYKPAMDIPTRLELLNEGEIPVGIDDPAAWAARLLEWRRDHGLDPALDALELRPGWPPAVELRRRIELRAGTHGLL